MLINQLYYLMYQARGSCASFVFGFVTFMSIGGFPSFVEDMKVSSRMNELRTGLQFVSSTQNMSKLVYVL